MKKVFFVICLAVLLTGANAMAASLAVNGTAAIDGSFGLQVLMDGDTTSAFVQDETPTNEVIYRALFKVNWNDVNFAANDNGPLSTHAIFKLWDMDEPGGVQRQHGVIGLRYDLAGNRRIWLKATDANTSAGHFTEWGMPATSAGYPVEVLLEFDQVNDLLRLCRKTGFVGATMVCSDVTTAEMGTHNVDQVTLGATGGVDAQTTGSYFLDTFESYRTLAP